MLNFGKKYPDYLEIVGKRGVVIRLGPMHLTIIAERRGAPLINEARRAAQVAVRLLEIVARHKSVLKKTISEIPRSNSLPKVVEEAIDACQLTHDKTLTPMAAVAGSIADVVADTLMEAGATKIVVNNGGDIAIRLEGDEYVKVGVAPTAGVYTHVIEVSADSGIGGIATSGLGGMGFTKGIASAATTLAKKASLADASSTVVGNATFSEGVKVIRCPAKLLDPDSDIADQEVTVKVGKISALSAIRAVKNGLKAANGLIEAGVLKGAVIFVDKYVGMTPKNLPVKPLTEKIDQYYRKITG
jgi:ApbE superfamily uncharacterized protein (UPF0280 family)